MLHFETEEIYNVTGRGKIAVVTFPGGKLDPPVSVGDRVCINRKIYEISGIELSRKGDEIDYNNIGLNIKEPSKMNLQIEEVEKYGVKVQSNTNMDELRRDQCLCLNCGKLPTGNCEQAQAFFRVCKAHNIALAVTRCPYFELKPK